MKKLLSRMMISVWIGLLLCQNVSAARALIPVGQIVGLELKNNTVTVAAFDEALSAGAGAEGLQVGDQILRIDTARITTTEDVRRALDRSDGTVQVTVRRGGRETTVTLTPQITRDGPKLGVYLRQGITGIGTVTFYDPETGVFGTLGHGVNDPGGGLLSLTQGSAYQARVASVRKGRSGEPGQLIGTLTGTQPMGTLYRNTHQGVFGITETPLSGQPLPVASAAQVRPGSASILSTVEGNTVREYSVEILKIYPADRTNGRNMLIHVNDPALLSTTGGIVQGMSGSPIIQEGKLIGAVTHVLVNDPTTGYGIFIENMLDAAA